MEFEERRKVKNKLEINKQKDTEKDKKNELSRVSERYQYLVKR